MIEVLFLFLLISDEENNIYNKVRHDKIFDLPENQFRELLRMSPYQFLKIRDKLFGFHKSCNRNRFTKKLLIFLLYISHHAVLRSLREQLGVSTFKIFNSVEKMAKFLFENSNNFIFLPVEQELESLCKEFSLLGNVLGTVLAIDGTHIPIAAPKNDTRGYFNRKQFHSLNFLVAVDSTMKIRFVTNGIGSAHDSRLYNESNALRNFVEGLPDNYSVVADQAFIGISKIKVPIRCPITNSERNFNFELGKQRIIVENAFGLFKGKFKRFYFEQHNGESLKHVRIVIGGMVIHNLLLDFKE